MSHKGKVNAASSTKSKKLAKSSVESKTENALQAVILADSFQDRFRPFTIEKPRCLLPLANTLLIEYTLEVLAMNGVDEVFIYCGSHTDQVEEYIGRSRWSTASRTCPFTVLQFVRVSNAQSVGDVLRDLDKRSLVDGNFLLVHGDLVSNLMLDGALAEHRKRAELDPANIMTVILRSGGENAHRSKTNGTSPVFAIDVPTKRILHYQEIYALQSKRYVDLDPAILDELSTDFEVRSDLIDAQVDICTPEVLALWSESFDYALPRKNFLHGVLKDWELNGKKIHAEIVSQDYAARASSLQMYDAISHDVLNRWTYPLIPENNCHPDMSYQRHDNGLVMERTAKHAPDALLANSVVGGGSIVGPTCRISNSVIGRGCHIGASVVIENSFIWDNTMIKDGTRILHSILGDSVVVGKDCLVSAGSLISFGVHVSDGISLREDTVLSTVTSSGNTVDADTTLLGPSTNAAHFVDPEDDEIDDDDPTRLQKTLLYSLADLNISASSISELESDDVASYDDATLEPAVAAVSIRSRLSSFASDDSSGKLSFHHDAVHGLMDALRMHSDDFNSAKVEFMGLRLANNASDAMLRKAVATAFARRATELTTAEHGALEPRRAADGALTARPGAARFIAEVGVGDGGVADQVEFVLALQRALWLHPVASDQAHADDSVRAGTLLVAMLQKLYALDVLEEDGILCWWEDGRAIEGEGMAVLRNKCRMLVEWLENASEEDDDEEDDNE